MKTPGNIVKREYFTYVLDTWHSFFQLCVGGYDLLLAGCDIINLVVGGCGWVWPFVTFFGLGVGGCGSVWPFSGWLLVSVGGCDLFLVGCRWVWVGVTFFWLGVGGCWWVWPFFDWVWVGLDECTAYNCPFKCNIFRWYWLWSIRGNLEKWKINEVLAKAKVCLNVPCICGK